MRTLPLLLTAAAVAIAGCDSTPIAVVVDGPTIAFGAQSVNVSETDGTIEIPVVLSNGQAGQTYTVEVLYAAASSTADYGADVGDFGAEAGANRVATVSLSGPSDEATVTITVLEDEAIEGPEVAVFALQSASGGAQIGSTREFQLQIGTPPIADARVRPDGDVVTVEGIVTGRYGRYTFLQDGTAGLTVYAFDDTNFGAASIEVGDRVQIRGTLSEFGAFDGPGTGLKQIFVGRDTPAEFQVLSSGNAFTPQTVTVAEILANGEAYESESIRIENLSFTTTDVVFGSSGNYTVTDGTGELTLRVNRSSDSSVGGEPIPASPFTYVGSLGQYAGGYQLLPLTPDDFQ